MYGSYGATQVKKPVAPTARPVARPVVKPVAKPVAVAPRPVAPAPISTPSVTVMPSKSSINPAILILGVMGVWFAFRIYEKFKPKKEEKSPLAWDSKSRSYKFSEEG